MKALIFFEEKMLKPTGGPAGYLYNIYTKKQQIDDQDLVFLNAENKKAGKHFMKIILPRLVRKIVYKNHPRMRYLKNISDNGKIPRVIDLAKYDLIHFHGTLDMYSAREDLKNYKGVVVLTTHSPKVFFRENIEDYMPPEEYEYFKNYYDGIEEIDKYAFKRADYIIFPCEGAEEPYYHSWPLYKNFRDSSKIRYLPTGIFPVFSSVNRKIIRKKYNIPETAILISFVGRHNEVKGYDLLQQIFSKIDDVYVICCGKILSIQPPDSNHWIEVGWTDDPYSIVAASDIYMLPNRETYFDIAMLQTLSLGKCSVISNTGGNKEFKNTAGVKLYNTLDEAVVYVKDFANMPIEKRVELEEQQRIEFRRKYSIDVFYRDYKKLLEGLVEEKAISNEQ